MRFFPIFLIIFGLIIIFNPEIIAYLIGGLLIFLGFNGIFLGYMFSKVKTSSQESYVKFGNYKIYR